jgi:hypothetical protein
VIEPAMPAAVESATASATATSAPAAPPAPSWRGWKPRPSARVPEAKPSASFVYDEETPKSATSARADEIPPAPSSIDVATPAPEASAPAAASAGTDAALDALEESPL